jgi:PAS domain S-box-containing protein
MHAPVGEVIVPPRGVSRRGGAGVQAWRLALLVLLVATAGAILLDRWYGRVRFQLLRESVRAEVIPTANALQTSLSARMSLLQGLTSFLQLSWDRPELDRDFDQFAAGLLRGTPGVRTVQYIRDGTIVRTWPLVGNEAAVGRNLLTDPRPMLGDDFRRATETPDRIVLSGPLELYQGGLGVVGRLAIRSTTDSLVGVAAVVVDLAPILVEAGVEANRRLTVALVDGAGHFIAGDSLLARDATAEPIRTAVRLADREWSLLAVHAGGWAATLAERRWPMRLALITVVLLLAGLAWLLAGRAEARAETERLRAEEKFARLFALTPDGVALTRFRDGMLLEVNDGFVEISGQPREQLLGRTSLEVRLWPTPEDRAAMVDAISRDGRINDFAVALTRPDGTMRETRLSGRLVDVNGDRCVLMIIRDVTEQRKLERRLAGAARLESLGRLAGGIAHDFNNLITSISGYARLLHDRVGDHPDAVLDVDEIVRASARAADLTAQLLAFARRQVVQPRVVDVNALIVDSNRRLRQLLGDDVVLRIRLSPDPAFIAIDPTQGDQLLTNLAVNARDAMPDGGTLTIQAQIAGDEVVLSFTDSGQGITPEVQAHLFEPFFTTKPAGKGTGLGLPTCYGIMEQAGGRIEVESTPGTGATFRLVFPRRDEADATPIAPLAEAASGRGGETILVAEDEEQVRKLVDRVLGRLGYTVLAAADGTEALAIAELHEGRIDLLLTDMVMPGMGGGELSRRMVERHPAIKVLLMSGYSEELVAAEHGEVPFLPKPFTPDELAAKVREVLAG